MIDNIRSDIVVIGAGFGGSLTALGLRQMGYDVAIIEKSSHPRFAIGESSTPIADLILRGVSERYDLPWLHEISRYGSWQQTHPQISCGLKRGFSYYKHKAGQPFQTDSAHKNELLVAASANDKQSDTNWYRSEVDAFFIDRVEKKGISYWDQTNVRNLQRMGNEWHITAQRYEHEFNFRCKWLIDATGSDSILNQLNITSGSENFRTNTSAMFSHFLNVKPWQSGLGEHGIPGNDYPYNPDHSALHQLLDEGWLWMLRFNNGITSAGLVFNHHKRQKFKTWNEIMGRYPSLMQLFEGAKLANSPGQFIRTSRLQRCAQKATGPGWVALPNTAGFVDPLHSTGIAHSLSGIERILYAFEIGRDKPERIEQKLERYERAVFDELDFMDLLIDGCYRAMDDFELFHTYASLYFVAAIHYEQRRLNGAFEMGDLFLSTDHAAIKNITKQAYHDLLTLFDNRTVTKKAVQNFRDTVEKALEPYNTAGLLHPEIPNMYYHTTAEF